MALVLRLTALGLASTLCVAAQAAHPSAALVDASMADSALHYKADQLIVQFRAGVQENAAAIVLSTLGAKSADVLLSQARRKDGLGDLRLVTLPANMSVKEAMEQLRAHPSVEFAEPNWIYKKDAKGTDPYYADGRLWGMYGADSPIHQNIYGSGAGTALADGKKCKATVVIGVIDEGVMTSHEDTQGNIWNNPFETAGNGKDDDGNGFVDDVHGWDFFEDNNSTFDGVGDDHGTHVSGTIGARANNAVGVMGVCSKLQLVNAKFLGPTGGSTADAVRAIDYITDLKTRHDMNIVATNNSWGGGGFSQAMEDAIARANDADILFIASAGSESSDNDRTPQYPSSYPDANIIAVTAITSSGTKASFANWGLASVDLGAPGVTIWSTVPVLQGGKVVGGYAAYSGTSMATPHVTGAAALYASLHPGASAAKIKKAILSHTIPTGDLAGRTVSGGRLDVSGF